MCFLFIPVYTGNIEQKPLDLRTDPVYPCVCREHNHLYYQIRKLHGLSLCIQGTSADVEIIDATSRFIPVYTGNIMAIPSTTVNNPGLSLCIQGTYDIFSIVLTVHRFIPVYTGNMIGAVGFASLLSGLSLCIQGT